MTQLNDLAQHLGREDLAIIAPDQLHKMNGMRVSAVIFDHAGQPAMPMAVAATGPDPDRDFVIQKMLEADRLTGVRFWQVAQDIVDYFVRLYSTSPTPAVPGGLQICRYDHGGARLYFEDGAGRDLVMDLYDDEPAERREAIIRVLLESGVLARPTPTSEPQP